ncbi:hypothetical protein DPMN_057466 [Dreissena polymorpha]|uniref:Uncharacterized protein n=1 Tax=Dreissena polymorpha TaxID=45954 RepID=A0A9D4C069_DREPO|nr:hypothetical protein DPMN_057466 [Dreissena polymorpha]
MVFYTVKALFSVNSIINWYCRLHLEMRYFRHYMMTLDIREEIGLRHYSSRGSPGQESIHSFSTMWLVVRGAYDERQHLIQPLWCQYSRQRLWK